MLTIKITGSNAQKVHNEYHKPFLCKADRAIPKMRNNGYNSFFFCEPVNFVFENMPLVEKTYANGKPLTSENYTWYDCSIEVTDPYGRKITGYYYATYDKKTCKFISEDYDFS